MIGLIKFFIALLLLGLTLWGTLKLIEKVAFPILEKLFTNFSNYSVRKWIKNYEVALLVTEISFLIITFIYLLSVLFFATGENVLAILTTIIVYSIYIIFLATFVATLKDHVDFKKSFIRKWISKINKDIYIINRLSLLFGRTALHFMIYIFVIYLLMVGIAYYQDIPRFAIYIFLLFIPIGLSIFVYMDNETSNIRKILVYLFLLAIALGKSYKDFSMLFEEIQETQLADYMFFLVLTIFIAIDRLVKSVMDDFHSFKEKS